MSCVYLLVSSSAKGTDLYAGTGASNIACNVHTAKQYVTHLHMARSTQPALRAALVTKPIAGWHAQQSSALEVGGICAAVAAQQVASTMAMHAC